MVVAGLITFMIILILELEFIPGIRLLDARRWRPAPDKSQENQQKPDA